jgi:hypothetical protein
MLTNVFLFFQECFRFLFPHLFQPDLFGFFIPLNFFVARLLRFCLLPLHFSECILYPRFQGRRWIDGNIDS